MVLFQARLCREQMWGPMVCKWICVVKKWDWYQFELSGEHSETIFQFLMTLLMVKLMFAVMVCSSFLYERQHEMQLCVPAVHLVIDKTTLSVIWTTSLQIQEQHNGNLVVLNILLFPQHLFFVVKLGGCLFVFFFAFFLAWDIFMSTWSLLPPSFSSTSLTVSGHLLTEVTSKFLALFSVSGISFC